MVQICYFIVIYLKEWKLNYLNLQILLKILEKAIKNKINEFGKFDGIINFHCVERTLELEEKNLEKQYAEIFSDIPTIGFSTYGEQFIGHMNQTSAMLVFRSKTNNK